MVRMPASMRVSSKRRAVSLCPAHLAHRPSQQAIPPTTLPGRQNSHPCTHPQHTIEDTTPRKHARLDGSEVPTVSDEEPHSRKPSETRRGDIFQKPQHVKDQNFVSRRAQNTSQDTVLINRSARSQDWAQFGIRKSANSANRLKLEAERAYHEQPGEKGVSRRRSMIRTVSKEDYLLGRGANPRTGLVTPGSTSQNNLPTQNDAVHHRNRSVPTKWRQKGDQWVSLDAGEHTPGPNMADQPGLILPKIRGVRGPRQPHGSETRNGDPTAESLEEAPIRGRAACTANQRRQDTYMEPSYDPPGTFPLSPQKELSTAQLPRTVTDLRVRRKPVRSLEKDGPPSIKVQDPQTPDQPSRYGADRSFSDPVPRRHFFSPGDVGVNAKQSFREDEVHRINVQESSSIPLESSFLELRSSVERSPSQTRRQVQPKSQIDLDKELPCLPMNNGRSLQSRSTSNPLTTNTARQDMPTMAHMQRSRPKTPITAADPSFSKNHRQAVSRHASPSIALKRGHRADHTKDHTMATVPNYDNPPADVAQRLTQRRVGGPRAMPPSHQITGLRSITNQRPGDPFNTTFTSINTSMPTRQNQGMQSRRTPHLSPGFHPAGSGNTYSSPIQGPRNMRRDPLSPLGNEIRDLPVPHTVPRGLLRPQMPSRAIGMRHMPHTSELRDRQDVMRTERHGQLKTTGIVRKNLPGEADIGTSLPNLRSATEAVAPFVSKERTDLEATGSSRAASDTLVRKCSRCQGGSVTVYLSDTREETGPGQPRKPSTASADAPEMTNHVQRPVPVAQRPENSTSQTPLGTTLTAGTTSATIMNVQEDLQDHSLCCLECCKKGCHELCLGHPNPTLMSGPSKRQTLHRIGSSTTLVSSSSESIASNTTAESPGKLSFFKSTLKSPFKHKRSADVLSTSNKSVPSVQEQLTSVPPATTSTDTTLYSGADGASGFFGAVAAAKKVIGFNSASECQENGLNQFMIPKKRPKTKKMGANIACLEDTISLVPAPLRVPNVSSSKSEATANESRKSSNSPPRSVSQSTARHVSPKSRTASSASSEIHIPTISGMGLRDVWELSVIVPLEAARMWLRNNPEALSYGWSLLCHVWKWTCSVTATSQMFLNMVYIYSKTGKLKIRNANGDDLGVVDLLRDCLRSALYVVVLVSLGIMLLRVVKVVVLPLRLLWLVGRFLLAGSRRTTTVLA